MSITDETYITLTENDYATIIPLKSKVSIEKIDEAYKKATLDKIPYISILKERGYSLWDVNRFLKDLSLERNSNILKAQMPKTEFKHIPKTLLLTDKTRDLLNSPNLLYKIHLTLAENIENEKINSLLSFILGLSHRTPYKQIVELKGDSSSGKNYLIDNTVAKYMPCRTRGRMSATAHEYGILNPFEILYIRQSIGKEPDSLKLTSSSDGGYSVETSIRNKETSEYETIVIKVPEITRFSSTINVSIGIENETRNWTITIDESEKQTRQILIKRDIIERNNICGYVEGENHKTLRDAISCLPIVDSIVVPYELNDLFPTTNIRARRDYNKFLDLIRLIAYLHSYQRDIKTNFEGKKILIANLEDVYYAIKIGGASLAGSVSGVDERVKEVHDAILIITLSPEKQQFTVLDVINQMKNISKSGKSIRTIKYCISALQQNNTIMRLNEKIGNSNVFVLNDNVDSIIKQPDYVKLSKGKDVIVFDPITNEQCNQCKTVASLSCILSVINNAPFGKQTVF